MMDNLARSEQQEIYSRVFADNLSNESSLSVVQPLEIFLAECRDPTALRDVSKLVRAALIADIAHFMCVSHGRLPGVVDHAASKIIDDSAREWLLKASEGFAVERAFLNKLTVAAGPMHSHSGQEKVSALLSSQSKSFEMLATSDRKGCAAGAAAAFIIDWQATRPLLDGVATLLSMSPPELKLPSETETYNLIASLSGDNRIERAMRFGADQMMAQQRGLWKIVAARHAEMRDKL